MKEKKGKTFDSEKIVRNGLILSTFISLVIVILNFTYLIYQGSYNNILLINEVLTKYVNGPLLWIDNAFVCVFAVIYIFMSVESKQEVLLKVSFSSFAILTTMPVLSFIINIVAFVFGIF